MGPNYMHVIYVCGVLISGHVMVRGRRACSLGMGGLGGGGGHRSAARAQLNAYGHTRRTPSLPTSHPLSTPPSSFSHFPDTSLLLKELSPSRNQKMLISGHNQNC